MRFFRKNNTDANFDPLKLIPDSLVVNYAKFEDVPDGLAGFLAVINCPLCPSNRN